MSTIQLVNKLKESNEDYEFYPTSKEMIFPIYRYLVTRLKGNVLDIGAGTCNFQKYYNEYCDEFLQKEESKYKKLKHIQVIEKSKELINILPKDTIVIGCDFDTTTLHDKDLGVIFCNPPYSKFVEWTCRVLHESNAEYTFMIIPKRWKENKDINAIVDKMRIETEVLGEFDFLEADRKARAYVDVVLFKKRKYEKHTAFDDWFDEMFETTEKVQDEIEVIDVKNEIELHENKIDFLVSNYERERDILNNNFHAVCSLNEDILRDIGVDKGKVKDSLRERLKQLKNKYWSLLFDQLSQVRDRLTTKYRNELRDKFIETNSVDFNHDNIYSTTLWILKNADNYCNNQITDLFSVLSDFDYVKPYKSNLNFFHKEKTRWHTSFYNSKNTHYTLDYRLVCSGLNFGVSGYTYSREQKTKNNIDDICVVARNLGFDIGGREYAIETGKKYYVYTVDGKELLEYKIFQNGNTHIKMSIEFSKAFNVEASRLLGWIKTKEQCKEEFEHTHLKGCEIYFKTNFSMLCNKNQLLLN